MYIYVITNKITKRQYVGQTKLNVYERWGRHILDAYRADRGNIKQKTDFHSAIVKYTPDAFEIKILEECDKTQADKKEIEWIQKLDTYNNGYNMTPGGQNIFKTKNNPVYKKYNKTGDFVKDTCDDIKKFEELNLYENNWNVLDL